MRRIFRGMAALSAVLLGACSVLVPAPVPVVYDCDGGKEFAITFLPGDAGAQIEFDRMRFQLRREPAASGTRYVCDVMSFTAQGETAQLDIQDQPTYRGCRARR